MTDKSLAIRFWGTRGNAARLAATLTFIEMPAESSACFADYGMTVSWAPLAHPQGCTGYRFDDEIDQYADWGHRSWGQARDAGRAAGVRRTMVTHHHPNQTAEKLRAHEAEGRPLRWARDGETVVLSGNRVMVQTGTLPGPRRRRAANEPAHRRTP